MGIIGVLVTRGHPTYIGPESVLTFRVEQPVTIATDHAPQSFRYVAPGEYNAQTNLQARPGPGYGAPGYAAPGAALLCGSWLLSVRLSLRLWLWIRLSVSVLWRILWAGHFRWRLRFSRWLPRWIPRGIPSLIRFSLFELDGPEIDSPARFILVWRFDPGKTRVYSDSWHFGFGLFPQP